MTAPPPKPEGEGLKSWADDLPPALQDLPRIGFVRRPANSRAESAETGVLFNIQSLDDLVLKVSPHFGLPVPRRK